MAKDFTELPALAQITANTHIEMLNHALSGKLSSYWIVGSAALGDFISGKSDLDFVAVTVDALAPEESETLRRMHRKLHGCRMLAGLDGWYVPAGGLAGNPSPKPDSLRFNEGTLRGKQPFITDTPDGWVLRQYGVRAAGEGPDPAYPADWEALLRGVQENMDGYWHAWAKRSRGFTQKALKLLASPQACEWGVLGITRLYYTLRERDVISKTGAGGYALQTLPPRWHGIVREAMQIRAGSAPRVALSASRKRETLAFMEYILGKCAR